MALPIYSTPSRTIHRQKSTKTCKKVHCGGLFGWNWWELDIGEQRKKKHPKNSKVIIRKALKYCWKLVLQHRYLPKVVELAFCQKRHLGLCWYCWWKKSCTSWYVVILLFTRFIYSRWCRISSINSSDQFSLDTHRVGSQVRVWCFAPRSVEMSQNLGGIRFTQKALEKKNWRSFLGCDVVGAIWSYGVLIYFPLIEGLFGTPESSQLTG